MLYELLALLGVLFTSFVKIIQKSIDIDPITLNLLSTTTFFIFFLIIVYFDFKNNPEKFEAKKNKLHLSNNPFKNMFSFRALQISLTGSTMYLLSLYCLKNLPFTLIAAINSLWIIPALFFNKLLRNIKITADKVISCIIVIIGVLVMSFNNLFNNKNKNKDEHQESSKNTILFSLILLFVGILKAYQINIIKQTEDYVTYRELPVMDFGLNSIFSIIIYLIYVFFPYKTWTVYFPKLNDIIKFILFVSILFVSSFYLKMYTLQKLTETVSNLLQSTSLIFAIILGKIFFNESISLNKIIGAIIIISGILYIKYHHDFSIQLDHLLPPILTM
jgi:drug/metabolite transporter (DMT)-like permease